MGEATIPASSADSHGASTEAHLGSGASPQPLRAGVAPSAVGVWLELPPGLKPCSLPKYTRAADSIPYAPLPK